MICRRCKKESMSTGIYDDSLPGEDFLKKEICYDCYEDIIKWK